MHGVKMEASGLPIYRRQRTSDEEVLSGADFLSHLVRSSYYQSYTTESTTHLTSSLPVTTQKPTTTSDVRDMQHIRHSRSTAYLPTVPQTSHHRQDSYEYSSEPLSSSSQQVDPNSQEFGSSSQQIVSDSQEFGSGSQQFEPNILQFESSHQQSELNDQQPNLGKQQIKTNRQKLGPSNQQLGSSSQQNDYSGQQLDYSSEQSDYGSQQSDYGSRQLDYSSENLTDNHLGRSEESSTVSNESQSDEELIIAVSVSSSVTKKPQAKSEQHTEIYERKPTTRYINNFNGAIVEYTDHNAVASQEHPSIIARASKSELSVEESEPITTNADLVPVEYSSSNSFPANVRPLSRASDASTFDTDIRPFHETVVFHDSPEPSRARSVSYSAVIQSIGHTGNQRGAWSDERDQVHDRRERHFDGANPSPNNDFSREMDKPRINSTKPSPSAAETNHFYVTTNPENEQSIENSWVAPEVYTPEIPLSEASSKTSTTTTEKNWEQSEKSYTPPQPQNLPTVYGQPEQNYEVDEAVSVNSNGRIHGVQTGQPQNTPSPESRITQPSKKPDDNQKVGYVVEGRNYRKYRVEERTSDGFIVGEYGVVSHDDGSLRGVRYTADGTINPRLIYDALMKFLSL